MFDTLVPQDHPGYVRRLAFPLEFRHKRANIHVDCDRDLGTPNKDEGLLPDPAQVVLGIDLWRDNEPRVLLVVRTQVLVEQVYSVHADSGVPWDEWGRDTVAIQVQEDSGQRPFIFFHGVRVVIVQPSFLHRGLSDYHVRTFDFSRCGRSSLPLWGGADGTTRRALFDEGTNLRPEPDIDIDLWDELQSLSDGSLIHLVSFFAQWSGVVC